MCSDECAGVTRRGTDTARRRSRLPQSIEELKTAMDAPDVAAPYRSEVFVEDLPGWTNAVQGHTCVPRPSSMTNAVAADAARRYKSGHGRDLAATSAGAALGRMLRRWLHGAAGRMGGVGRRGAEPTDAGLAGARPAPLRNPLRRLP
ncbi:MAG: hypothetical protein U1F07_04715 [Rubrivivax sp.]